MTSADHVQRLLAEKHSGDVFVPQCKNGSTFKTRQLRVLDAWVLRKTWSPITTVGYEVKVARGDFLRDDKWPAYLPLCHQLYFVSPYGLVSPEELPAEVGLMWVAKTGSRLYTKRKALRREIELPAHLLLYVLMSRARIVRDMGEAAGPGASTYWRTWLAQRREHHDLGRRVSYEVSRHVRALHRSNVDLTRRIGELEAVRKRLLELGLNPDSHVGEWNLTAALTRATTPPDDRLARRAESLASQLEQLARDLRDGVR